jgi:hypothetical protein
MNYTGAGLVGRRPARPREARLANSYSFSWEALVFREISPGRRAVHEAGHAALAIEGGIGIDYVTIQIANGGFCEYEPGLNVELEYNFPARGVAYVLAMLGGIQAEKRFAAENGMPEQPLYPLAWSRDVQLAEKGIAWIFIHSLAATADADTEFHALCARARAFIDDAGVWAGVNAIADELVKNGRVEGARVEAIYRQTRDGQR